MSGIGGIGGMGSIPGANPLAGMATGDSANGMPGGALSGFGDLGIEPGGGGTNQGPSLSMGMAPTQPASAAQGESFGDTLKAMVIESPSASKARSSELAARFAAGDTSIDPHVLSIQSAKAGVEIQMATRSISSAVSAVRTLFQMQV